jgi:hypothetical protein
MKLMMAGGAAAVETIFVTRAGIVNHWLLSAHKTARTSKGNLAMITFSFTAICKIHRYDVPPIFVLSTALYTGVNRYSEYQVPGTVYRLANTLRGTGVTWYLVPGLHVKCDVPVHT